MSGGARLLCIMGSGELSARMAPVHRELMKRAGSPPGPAVMLDTSYGFQENADELSKRAQDFFQNRLRQPLDIASFRDKAQADVLARERVYSQLRDATYLFAGPGSPSYALRQWHGTRIPDLIGAHLFKGGCVTFASAAAVTLGRVALPVYEIYKVGQRAHWIQGLDVLSPVGLDVAVIPHYDNAEGGTHDTRYCYMGERRLLQLESQLPDGVGILGIAEHTAAIVDFVAGTLEVRGRGFVAIRHGGAERCVGAGSRVALGEVGARGPTRETQQVPGPALSKRPAHKHLLEEASRHRRDFDRAIEQSDSDAAVATLLEFDTQIADWAAQSRDREDLEEARSIYRGMLVRFAEGAKRGLAGPREPVAPFIELALRLRDEARRERRYPEADLVRDALADLGIKVRDTPVGPQWSSRTEH
ncbi:MAG TPA: hypothetical protein VM674_01290 [Candidatus Acidoferrum sp.]|nr:hypothetical protein [Candidatus Acidoferrum sp.]